MCRLLGYVGPPVTLDRLVLDPPHSLLKQSYQPQQQQHGVVNADGFGVGWYSPAHRPEPAVYRSTRPIWSDRSFASVAGVIESGLVIASVRSATPPAPTEEAGTAPFTQGRWLFSHNGFLDQFRTGRGEELRRGVSVERASQIESAADSEVVFAMVLDLLDGGADAAAALRKVVDQLAPGNHGGLNLMLSDGQRLVATAVNNSLHTLRDQVDGRTSFWVASEPVDDRTGWKAVPDRSLVDVRGGSLSVSAL